MGRVCFGEGFPLYLYVEENYELYSGDFDIVMEFEGRCCKASRVPDEVAAFLSGRVVC